MQSWQIKALEPEVSALKHLDGFIHEHVLYFLMGATTSAPGTRLTHSHHIGNHRIVIATTMILIDPGRRAAARRLRVINSPACFSAMPTMQVIIL
jgi:hypothetical protein